MIYTKRVETKKGISLQIWLALESTKELVAFLIEESDAGMSASVQNQVLTVIKGGSKKQGAYACKELVYNIVVPVEIMKEIDEKKESERIHQWFTKDGGRERLSEQIKLVSSIAKTCRTYGEFKIKLSCIFNDTPLQLEMF